MAKSLWPKIDSAPIRSPIDVLQEQAEALPEATGGMLKGGLEHSRGKSNTVGVRLFVVAPHLNDYRVEMIKCTFDPRLPYPCYLECDIIWNPGNDVDPFEDMRVQVRTESELTETLANVFTNEAVVALLTQLVGLSKKANEIPF